MRKSHALAAFLALGSLAALPACSMNSGHSGSTVAAARPSEVSPGMVRQVQTALQQQGLYKGNVDGIWGPETQSAVMGYQQAHGLPPNGELTSPTLASLNLPADGTTTPMAAAPMAPAPVAAPPPPAPTPMAAAPPAPLATAPATTTTQ
jgi:peptidoglycan hydrolase-like protein with peptidoglycan-binding domain